MTESSVAGNDDRRTTHQNTTDQNTADQNTAAPASAARVGNSRNRAGDKMLIALDVDGTLVDHDGHMSVPVREAAQAVVAAGHHVMIATGRSLNATLPVIEHIGIDERLRRVLQRRRDPARRLRPARGLRNPPQGNV